MSHAHMLLQLAQNQVFRIHLGFFAEGIEDPSLNIGWSPLLTCDISSHVWYRCAGG